MATFTSYKVKFISPNMIYVENKNSVKILIRLLLLLFLLFERTKVLDLLVNVLRRILVVVTLLVDQVRSNVSTYAYNYLIVTSDFAIVYTKKFLYKQKLRVGVS
ncbi:uncharacterized protein LOC143148487 [Ptiloglossa arizonensis]|uniref:uncharacterized protein LOC143148487 n=1 Tax=Ptiloglossa arizonensis TaxID=3350558 RepID=UPI003F9FA1CA